MTDPLEIPPPRSLTKAEKATFERVISLRKSAGNPVSSAEIDTLIDYVTCRSRLAQLRRALRQYGDLRFDFDRVLAANRAINSTTATARRLARDLKIAS